jgi:hypothetical protein
MDCCMDVGVMHGHSVPLPAAGQRIQSTEVDLVLF